MLVSLSLIIFSIINLTFACPTCLRQVDYLRAPPHHWRPFKPAEALHRFQLSIAPHKGDHIQEALYAISTPGHAQYGMHLSRSEARRLLSADDGVHQDIIHWITENGVLASDISNEDHWIRFNTTVANANRMLAAKFTWYKNPNSNEVALRTLQYSVPEALYTKISLISPTTRFCSMKMTMEMRPQLQHQDLKRRLIQPAANEIPVLKLGKRATVDPTCNRTITPSCIRALYNVPANMTLSKARGVGVYASQNQVAKFEDFRLFIKNIAPDVTGTNFTLLSINNGTTDQRDIIDSALEVNFDVQYSASLSSPVPNVVFAIGGEGPIQPELGNQPGDGTEPWLQWLDAMLALPADQLPHTITTSFGENEQSLPNGYVQQVCNQFGALGARGVSMIAASGDSGPGSTCVTNDGKNTTRFTPIFPGSCPYVTAVGGVKGIAPETATTFSAGGFSDKFARPSYQDTAVPAYLKTVGKQFDGLFNATGRGFPDVAAQSFNLTFVDQGFIKGFAGTSAASPTWAGLIGMVNAALIAQNKAPLGFLNPWLYSTGLAGMNDIVNGASVGCTGSNPFTGQVLPAEFGPKIVANAGWAATAGWDAVTGLGTPNVGKLMALAMGAGNKSSTGGR